MLDSLLKAYFSAYYQVYVRGKNLTIELEKNNTLIDECLKQNSVTSAAFITAHNPVSQMLSEQENKLRNQLLKKQINDSGYSFFIGSGGDIKRQWPEEESFLILGVSKGYADRLAANFSQLAYLWVVRNKPVKLIYTRHLDILLENAQPLLCLKDPVNFELPETKTISQPEYEIFATTEK